MGAPIEFRVLGTFEVTGIGTPVLGGRRQQSALVLLALNVGRPLSRDRIIESIWVDPPRSAVSTLQGYLSHLRKALDGLPLSIVSYSGGYRFVGADVVVDSCRFDDLTSAAADHLRSGARGAEQAALAALEEGLGLWRGPALEDFLSAPFASEEARRLELRRVDASMMRAEVLIDLGRCADAVEVLEPLVAENAYQEECCRLLMKALYGAGRQRDALAAFARIRTVLREEFGLEPAPALASMELRILRHDESLTRGGRDRVGLDRRGSRRSPWPVYSTRFIGRQAEIAEVSGLLAARRLVTITGPGGAGKTRLAVASAEAFGDGAAFDQWAFVDLAGRTDRAGLLSAAAAAVSDLNITPTVDAIVVALRGRRCLLVLDNCEHIVSHCGDLVADLLTRTESTSIVATSREPLGIEAETVWAIPPLALPGSDDPVEMVLESDSVQLFLARCESLAGATVRQAGETAVIAEIVRHAEGMPLAIELASSASRSFALGDVRDRLRGTIRLDEPIPGAPSRRHSSLSEVIDWSFRLLSQVEQRLLIRLGAFQGRFGLADIEAVCCEEELSPREAFTALGKLVRSSLVVLRPGEEDRPYGLLDMIRAFAASRLDSDAAELQRCRDRHLEHFANLATEARVALTATEPARWLRVVDQVESDLLAALDASRARGDADRAAALALVLSDHRVARYRLDDAEAVLQTVRAWLPEDHPSQPELAMGLATAAHLLDDFGSARGYCMQAIGAAERSGDHVGVGFALARLAEVVRSADNDANKAVELIEEAQHLAEEHDSALLAVEALRLRSALEWDAGNIGTAESEMRDWRRRARKAGNARAAAEASLQLAGLLSGRGGYRESDQLCDEAADFYATTGDPLESAYVSYTKGRSLLFQGDLDGAAEHAGRAREAFERIGDDWGVGIALRVLGEARLRAGVLAEAGDDLRRSLDLMLQRGFADDVAATSDPLARWALATGDVDHAAELVRAALEGLGDRSSRNRGPLLRTSGMIEARLGHLREARRLIAEAVEECRRTGTADALRSAEAALAEVQLPPRG